MNNENIDYLLTYSELQCLLKGRDISPEECKEEDFESTASKQGRNYGITGGVSEAVISVLKDKSSAKPYIVNGINKETIKELRKFAKTGSCPNCNLIEVMACEGGCLGGNATITDQKTAKKQINNLLDISKDLKRD